MSLEQNIATQILDPFAPLHREPDFLLREVERYYGILLAVATGHANLGQIAAQTGIEVRHLNYYLQQLHQLGYLDRGQPLLPAGVKRRTVRYAIGDPLFRRALPRGIADPAGGGRHRGWGHGR